MKKIIVIGANSYIARNLIYILNKRYRDIKVKLYDYADKHADRADNYESVSVLNPEALKMLDLNCDYIFMFTGKAGTANGFDEFEEFINVNEKALLNLLNEYRRQKSKAKIIFPSTRLVYKGKAGLIKEDDVKSFKTVYAVNKYACEQYLYQYNLVYDIQYCVFRICVPYGSLIPNASSYGTAEFMLKKASAGNNITLYGDGTTRRTIIYIEDLCEALIQGALCDKCCNDVFNIGGENYSLKEMAGQIAKKYNVGVDYVPWPDIAGKIESGDTVFDDSKLQKICPVLYKTSFEKWCSDY